MLLESTGIPSYVSYSPGPAQHRRASTVERPRVVYYTLPNMQRPKGRESTKHHSGCPQPQQHIGSTTRGHSHTLPCARTRRPFCQREKERKNQAASVGRSARSRHRLIRRKQSTTGRWKEVGTPGQRPNLSPDAPCLLDIVLVRLPTACTTSLVSLINGQAPKATHPHNAPRQAAVVTCRGLDPSGQRLCMWTG